MAKDIEKRLEEIEYRLSRIEEALFGVRKGDKRSIAWKIDYLMSLDIEDALNDLYGDKHTIKIIGKLSEDPFKVEK
jgi:hypothetical protein